MEQKPPLRNKSNSVDANTYIKTGQVQNRKSEKKKRSATSVDEYIFCTNPFLVETEAVLEG